MIETIYCWRLVCVFVIAILGSASAQTFNVSIIVSPPMTGQVNEGQVLSYTLNCSAASSSGPPPNVTWVSYPSGAVLNNTSSRILVLPSPVQLSYAGLYVCNASANGVSRTASYAFNVSVRTLLLIPAITVTNIPSTLNYQGSLLVLVCSYGIQGIQAVNLTGYSIQWAGPTPQSVEADGQRVSIATSNSSAGGGGGIIYTSNLIISSLSKKDGGTYTCTPSVGPKAFSPYVIPYTEPKTSQPVTVLDLPLSVTVSPANLLSSSNSTFQINCTATKPSSVPLPFVFVWSWKDTYNGGSVLTFNSSGTFTSGGTTFVTTQPPGVTNSTPNVTSTLTVSLPLPGTHSCQCDVVINVPIDGPTNRTASATVSVPGRPNQPTNVTAKSISMNTISVQWQIPYIVYTQERYVVQYGLAPSNLSQSSMVVNWSAYLSTSGGQFSVNLTGLIPNSLYYYTIVASNTEGTTSTPVMNIFFFPLSSSILSSTPVMSNSPIPLQITSYAGLAGLVVLAVPIAIVVVIIILMFYVRARRKESRTNDEPSIILQNRAGEGVSPHSKPEHGSTDCNRELRSSDSSKAPVVQSDSSKAPVVQSNSSKTSIVQSDSSKAPVVQSDSSKAPVVQSDSSKAPVVQSDSSKAPVVQSDSSKAPVVQSNSSKAPVDQNELEKMIDSRCNNHSSGWSEAWKHLKNECVNNSTSHTVPGYTNATFIDGYKKRPNAYIAAQAPLQNTVEDFKKMVSKFKCMNIVILCNSDEEVNVVEIWPSDILCDQKKSEYNTGEEYRVYKLPGEKDQKSTVVTLYHYIGWSKDGLPGDNDLFIKFCSEVQTKTEGDEGPVVVTCIDDVGRAGAFITVLAMIEMARKEKKVDIDSFIKSSMKRCPQFIGCIDHYRLCYETILYWYQFSDSEDQSDQGRYQEFNQVQVPHLARNGESTDL